MVELQALDSNWDAQRLVKEYVKVANLVNHSSSFNELPWNVQVRVQRVAAVLSAYFQEDNSGKCPLKTIRRFFPISVHSELNDCSKFDTDDLAELESRILQISDDRRLKHLIERFDVERDRLYLLKVLLEHRISIEDLLGHFSGVIDGNSGVFIGYNMIRELYNPKIEESNDLIDKIIALLLGPKFRSSFSVAELMEKYNYPSATDEELLDYKLDLL